MQWVALKPVKQRPVHIQQETRCVPRSRCGTADPPTASHHKKIEGPSPCLLMRNVSFLLLFYAIRATTIRVAK
jgi:hypothetical protein